MKRCKRILALAIILGLTCQMNSMAKSLSLLNTPKSKGEIVVRKEQSSNEIKVRKEKEENIPQKTTKKSNKVEKVIIANAKKALGSKAEKIITQITQKAESKVNSAPKINDNIKITSEGPMVRVLLKNLTQGTLTLVPVDRVEILDAKQNVKKEISANKKIQITTKGNEIYLDGKKMGAEITIQAANKNASTIIAVDNMKYRGAINIKNTAKNKAAIINKVSMEEYLCGVLPKEVPSSWPQPALQAQAVAARTYAYHALEKKTNALYDVETDTRSQVYQGVVAETMNTNKAVEATKGMVLKYKGKIIDAVFHADAGGHTEDAKHVWGQDTPYLRGVKEIDRKDDLKRQSYTWQVETTREAMEAKLKAASKSVGRLKEIDISPLQARPVSANDRGKSGRIIKATFIGSKGKITLSGNDIKAIFGLKSSCVDFYINHQPPNDIDSAKKAKSYHKFGKGNEKVYIKGYGYGHGLGLSQWGAAYMAKQAKANDKDYYKKILQHYYQGVEIDKIY